MNLDLDKLACPDDYRGGDGWEIAIDGIDYNNRDIFSVRDE